MAWKSGSDPIGRLFAAVLTVAPLSIDHIPVQGAVVERALRPQPAHPLFWIAPPVITGPPADWFWSPEPTPFRR
jgi:hypothetical protein